MQVLNTLIGLRGLKDGNGEEIKPTSGRYVNDLPGMASEMYSQIANADQTDAAGVWQTVVNRSKDLFLEMVAAAIETETSFTRSLFQTDGLQVSSDKTVYSGDDYAGVYLFIPDSKLTDVFIKSVWLQTPEAIAATLVIFDLESGAPVSLVSESGETVLIEQEIELTAGLNEIAINAFTQTPFKDLNLFIAVKGAPLVMLQTPDLGDARFNYLGVISTAADVINNVNGYSDTAAPLFVEVSAECSLEKYITRNVKRFTPAFQYLLAAETIREKIHSPRANFWSNGNIALSEENLNYFSTQALKFVSSVVSKTPVSDLCGCSKAGPVISYFNSGV